MMDVSYHHSSALTKSSENRSMYITASGYTFFADSNLDVRIDISPDGFLTYRNSSGALHRTNGPAVIYPNGSKQYWVMGNELPIDEYFVVHGVM